MKINYLKLNNIGPYYGLHVFNLNTTSVNNIILIGGKNGAGKTTFLKAIKYGLFGCFALGLKNETSVYLNEIKSFINNKAKKDYYIEIEYEYIENFEINKYVLKRFWKFVNGELKESVNITMNGDYDLDEIETKEIMDKLRAITTPNLINSFIFDGEKISQIIEHSETSTYLKETFNSLFSVDLLEQTQKDLQYYLNKKSEENKSKDQIESVSLLNKIDSLKNQVKSCENDILIAKQSVNNLLALRSSNENDFFKLGGLTKKQQQSFVEKMNKISKKKEEMGKVTKEYVENDLPLMINIDLLQDAQKQIYLERQSNYGQWLTEIETFLQKDLKELKNELNLMIKDTKVIHNLSTNYFDTVGNKIVNLLNGTKKVEEFLGNKLSLFDEYKQMQKQVLNNDNIEKINLIIEEIRKIDFSLNELNNQLSEYKIRYNSLQSDLNLNYQLYEKMNDELKKNRLYDSSFILASDCISICEKFAKVLTKHKLLKVSKTALEIFNDTIRKIDFITNLEIDEDFNLKLYNFENQLIDPKILSAGEMQILVSSLIWTMFRISGRREMFIFDTPLARLDNDNRLNFINKIISTISHQVVILSTDSEFVDDNLDAIENRIYKKYLLNYNVKTATTTVDENYFGGK